jgi:hypothetical protein
MKKNARRCMYGSVSILKHSRDIARAQSRMPGSHDLAVARRTIEIGQQILNWSRPFTAHAGQPGRRFKAPLSCPMLSQAARGTERQ